jgi:hypothetical protein
MGKPQIRCVTLHCSLRPLIAHGDFYGRAFYSVEILKYSIKRLGVKVNICLRFTAILIEKQLISSCFHLFLALYF